ncbi:MAG: DNA polymerase III subunit beta [Candidatus Heimdallarchaeota archaeon]|nr:MAG: DNA polymerase III subunit beta [Candidatus Heimdallarchaeota archaeon]
MTEIRSEENNKVSVYLDILREYFQDIQKRFKVNYLGIFGSYVRKEQKELSDIDILVEFYETPSLFQFIRLENYLCELLKIKVDLVMKEALRPNIGKQILEEVIKV